MPEILPNLHQEPMPGAYDWDRFDVIVSMVGIAGRPGMVPPPGKTLIVRSEDDGETIPDIEEIAKLLARYVLQGRRVMVHCAAGLNRSGLMVGLTLFHMGVSPIRAVEFIRSAVPDALCNPHFEKHLKDRGGT